MVRNFVCCLLLVSCSPAHEPSDRSHGEPAAGDKLSWLPPEAFLLAEDQERARRREPGKRPCARTRVEDGFEVDSTLPTDACVRMRPRQRFRGVWLDRFEGSSFSPGLDRVPTKEPTIFLNADRAIPRRYDGAAYLLEFEGRQTLYRWSYGPCCFEHEIIVDRLISATPLDARRRP